MSDIHDNANERYNHRKGFLDLAIDPMLDLFAEIEKLKRKRMR